MLQKENLTSQQLTYNALGREAMLFGIPIAAIGASVVSAVFMTVFALPFIHAKAFFVLLLTIPVLLFIRQICANDDKACRIFSLEAQWWGRKWLWRSNNVRMFGGTNSILALKFGGQTSECIRFFEQTAQSASGARRLSAESLPTRHT